MDNLIKQTVFNCWDNSNGSAHFAKRRVVRLEALIGVGLILGFGGQMAFAAAEDAAIPSAVIPRVEIMPRLPAPYALRDWAQVTRNYIHFVFDFNRSGEHLPLMRWTDDARRTFWMPAYVGDPDGPESINYLAAVVSGSLVGLDMRSYAGTDWLRLATNFYNPVDGIVLDRPTDRSGSSMWYDVFPNVLLFQLKSQYPHGSVPDEMLRKIAARFYEQCVQLGGRTNPLALPDFDHTGFDLRVMKPYDNGVRIAPEGAAGIAWIEYIAGRKFHDPRFLTAADWSLQALESRSLKDSPLYEVLLPYAVITAARMNQEEGRDYDVRRLLNWCFQPRPAPQARPYWGVITGRWNGLDVDGLVGSSSDGGGYAFAMNTFEFAGTLAPLARYDARYARALGRWLLNLANAARLYYGNASDAEHQSSYAWDSKYDPQGVIAYEGLRHWKRGWTSAAEDYSNEAGKVVSGSYVSTRYYREQPIDCEVLEETPVSDSIGLSHVWRLNLPTSSLPKFLAVAANRVNGGHQNNAFCFSYATNAAGPFYQAFCVISNAQPPQAVELPANLHGQLFVKVENTDRTPGQSAADRLWVDALAISYQSDLGPFAQGDQLVSFVDLV